MNFDCCRYNGQSTRFILFFSQIVFEDLIPDLQAIIELQTGVSPQTPREWPYSKETNEEQATDTRLSGLRELFRRIYLTEDL